MVNTRKIVVALLALLGIFNLSLLISCSPEKFDFDWIIDSTKYVFIDHHVNTYGELIEGKYSSLNIDFPLYKFNKETGILTSLVDFKVDKAKLTTTDSIVNYGIMDKSKIKVEKK